MATIIPKLGLQTIKDAALDDYALDKAKKIASSGNFSGVSPSAAQLKAKAKQYDQALVKAMDGTRADTVRKQALRKELHQMLSAQALDCARIANGNLSIYLSSGYEAKNAGGTPVGELESITSLHVEPTQNESELKADWNRIDKAQNYSLRAFTDLKNPEGSIIFNDIFRPSKALIEGLPSGEKVYIQVRANGGSTGHGPWSKEVWARPR